MIIDGDLNCHLQRNICIQGYTGKWCMTQHANKGHGGKILDMMRSHDLCVIDTYFNPKRKKWNDRHRYCNATYIPKDTTHRPTKLDYLLISNRWKSMVMNVETWWGSCIHRFVHQFSVPVLVTPRFTYNHITDSTIGEETTDGDLVKWIRVCSDSTTY